jgi:hypothetical protein
MKRPTSRAFASVAFFLVLTAPIPAAASGLSYEAFAGVDAGNGEAGSGTIIGNGGSGSGLNCTTYGPSSLQISSFSNEFTAPAGGIGPCNYYGGAIDVIGSTSKTVSTGSVSANFSGNVFTGSATGSSTSAVNGEFSLHATATGNYTGSLGPTTETVGAGAAAADDPNWSVSCPLCSAGETIVPTFWWTYTASITTNQNFVFQVTPYGTFGLELVMDLNNEGVHPAFEVFDGGGTGDPSWNCFSNPICPSFTVGPGSMSGTSNFNYTPNESVTLGAGNTVTVDEEVELAVQSGNTATVDPDAVLTAVTWATTGGTSISGVTVTTSTGVYADGGYTAFSSAAPEPASWLLCALGLGAVLIGIRKRGSALG